MVCCEYGYVCVLVYWCTYAYLRHMAVYNATSLPFVNGHVLVAIHPFSIRVDVSDDSLRLLQAPVRFRLYLRCFRTGQIPAPREHLALRSSS